ncbi:hypothetical protein [Haladaptatus sp. NG-SE-30]
MAVASPSTTANIYLLNRSNAFAEGGDAHPDRDDRKERTGTVMPIANDK